MAIKLRMFYKQIIESQACLLQLCQTCLQNLKGKRLNIKDEMEMRKLGQIKEYINSLERGKIWIIGFHSFNETKINLFVFGCETQKQ